MTPSFPTRRSSDLFMVARLLRYTPRPEAVVIGDQQVSDFRIIHPLPDLARDELRDLVVCRPVVHHVLEAADPHGEARRLVLLLPERLPLLRRQVESAPVVWRMQEARCCLLAQDRKTGV